ncbi:carboxymuconolactone decarboxylase family protein [Luteococcus sp. H138]|uniref:carboxymuconolactone decarboxylase family protein n=1 Tax=unclassified Luteococcus TaxID=2639923 RepID=UPI00313B6D60
MTDSSFQRRHDALRQTDPEFVEWFTRFARDEVTAHGQVDVHTRQLVRLAALLACQARVEFRETAEVALDDGLTPVELKELVYQATPYLGVGKVRDFLEISNEVLAARGVALPLEPRGTVTPDTRRDQGWKAQTTIFGETPIRAMHDAATEETRWVQEWLTANCFGDHYTRDGIDLRTRELLTLVLLISHGGCDAQVRGHVAGNVNVGNDRGVLLAVLSQLVPYIGYPRTLNGLAAINEVAPAQ